VKKILTSVSFSFDMDFFLIVKIAWIIQGPICVAQRMKPYSYTANALQQSRSACPEGENYFG